MNRPFERVYNSPINRSPTKSAHAFGRARRFDLSVSPMYSSIAISRQSCYCHMGDHGANATHRDRTSVSPRFGSRYGGDPSPGQYKIESFVDEAKRQKKGLLINTS
jgi:hypothetical protein